MASSPTTSTAPSWSDLRTVGPVLMIVFGLVLFFTPFASVGPSGSVGNAGALFPKCPPGSDSEECPPVDDCPVSPPGGGAGSVVPDDCPPVDECPDGPGGNFGNAAFVAPDDCPPVVDPDPDTDPGVESEEGTIDPLPPVPPAGDPDCPPAGTVATDPGAPVLGPDPTEVTTTTTGGGGQAGGGTVVIGGIVGPDLDDCPDPVAAVTDTATGGSPASAAPAPQRTELARTGVERDTVIASAAGLALVVAGAGLLVLSRRRLA